MTTLVPLDRRHGPNRRKTRIDAVIASGEEHVTAIILNISFDGMNLSVPRPFTSGTPITIEVLKRRIPAIVHWSKDGQIGVHLLERLGGQTLIALENAAAPLDEYH